MFDKMKYHDLLQFVNKIPLFNQIWSMVIIRREIHNKKIKLEHEEFHEDIKSFEGHEET